MSQQIIDNLKHLIGMVEAFPEERLDLAAYERETNCGTLYCTAGLACTDAGFMAQLQAENDHLDYDVAKSSMENRADLLSDSSQMFGDSPDSRWGRSLPYDALFDGRGFGSYDRELFAVKPGMTDKDLALARLRRQLARYEGDLP